MRTLLIRTTVFFAFVFGIILPASGQAIPWAEVDALGQNYVKKGKNPGLVIGIIRGDVSEVRGYGARSRMDKRPPDGRTIFEIGGLTSVFTTSAVVLASRDHSFALGDPIQPYLKVQAPAFHPQRCVEITLPTNERIVSCSPDLVAEDICISFCDLADHTSGISCSCGGGYEWNPFVDVRFANDTFCDLSKEALYVALGDMKLETAPGRHFRYSNIGIALLGNLVGDRFGGSYADLLGQYVTGPLNMPDTRLRLNLEQAARRAPGYDYRGRPAPPWTFDAMAPAAGLNSTADDLLRFLSANLQRGSQPLEEAFETVRQARFDISFPGWERPTSAGYGWLISRIGVHNNLPVAWINGGTGGYRAWMGLNTDTRTALVVLSNSAQPVDELAWLIMDMLVGGKK